MFLWKTPAQKAGKRAGQTWLKVSDHLDEDVELLTGRELLDHAQEEARKWLRSTHRIDGNWAWEQTDYKNPEQKYHEEFLQYVEAFILALPPASKGSPKE